MTARRNICPAKMTDNEALAQATGNEGSFGLRSAGGAAGRLSEIRADGLADPDYGAGASADAGCA